jgi:predicted DCC family thiol-disulfide oxidoreductase YuxK
VGLLLRLDRRGVLRFAPLQGPTARDRLGAARADGRDTVVLLDAAGLHERSEAVLRILAHVGAPWRALAALGRVVPARWRDAAYRAVTRRRYRWFGCRDACRVPEAGERERFLP